MVPQTGSVTRPTFDLHCVGPPQWACSERLESGLYISNKTRGPPNAADKRTAPRRAGGTTVAGRAGAVGAPLAEWEPAPSPQTIPSVGNLVQVAVPASGVTTA